VLYFWKILKTKKVADGSHEVVRNAKW